MNAFPWNNHNLQKCFMYILAILYCHRILKRHVFKDQRFNKMNNFHFFVKDILKWNQRFCLLWMCGSEEYNDYWYNRFLCHGKHQFYPALLLHYQCKCTTHRKKTNDVWILQNCFHSLKEPKGPPSHPCGLQTNSLKTDGLRFVEQASKMSTRKPCLKQPNGFSPRDFL